MILLIDGYNLIKQALQKAEISEYERENFISRLGKYGKIRGHKVELVFDGGPTDNPLKESLYGVYVTYSGYKKSADDYIKDYLDRNRALDILLVSSDRDICRHAARLDVEQIDSVDFYSIMSDLLGNTRAEKQQKACQAVKLSKDENLELDELMRQSTKIVQRKLDDLEHGEFYGVKGNKLAKKAAKKLRKIKKL